LKVLEEYEKLYDEEWWYNHLDKQIKDQDAMDAEKVKALAEDESVKNLAVLEPVAIDPTKAATKALEACGNDVEKAKAWIAEKVQDTSFKWD